MERVPALVSTARLMCWRLTLLGTLGDVFTLIGPGTGQPVRRAAVAVLSRRACRRDACIPLPQAWQVRPLWPWLAGAGETATRNQEASR